MLLVPGLVFATGGDENGNGAADPPGGTETFGVADEKETPISVGSVLGQATLRDSKCVIDTPITVGARVPNGNAGVVITWAFDDECRAVVQEIRPGQAGDTEPYEGGQSESPTPSAATPSHESSHSANPASSIETRTGWVNYLIGEQSNLPAAQVYAEMGY